MVAKGVGCEEPGLEGCIKTLLAIEGGNFPDEGCLECENLEKCLKLEPEVRRGLAAER